MSTTLNITTLLTPKIVFFCWQRNSVQCSMFHGGLFYAIVFSCLMRQCYMCDIVCRRIDWNSNYYCCWLFADYEARDNNHNFYIDNGNNINQKLHQMKCWSLVKLDIRVKYVKDEPENWVTIYLVFLRKNTYMCVDVGVVITRYMHDTMGLYYCSERKKTWCQYEEHTRFQGIEKSGIKQIDRQKVCRKWCIE